MGEGRAITGAHASNGAGHAPDVPAGYKRTEVGVIPEDWGVDRIDQHTFIRTGSKNTQDKQEGGEYPFFVRSQEVERIGTYSYDGEAVLTAGDGAGTGKVYHYVRGRFDVHQRVYRISDFGDRLNGRYFFFQFSEGFYNRIMSMTAKSSVDSVRMEMIAGMRIPLPPPREQRAIAAVLSDVDELIGSLEALIAKKRAIKQAAMQQLLTGRTRLPGFGGEWDAVALGSLLSVRHGRDHQGFMTKHGRYPVLGSGGIIGRMNRSIFRKPSVLIGRKGTITKPQFMSEPFWAVDTLFYTEIGLGGSAKFLYYLFCQIDWLAHNEASGLPSLNSRTIERILVSVPPLPEQQAIATVLSDMDTEIAALERRLDKTRAIKQGMMQQLLTGSTRLLIPDAHTEGDHAHDA